MDGTEKRKRYYCAHCKQDVSQTTFYDHKRLMKLLQNSYVMRTMDSTAQFCLSICFPIDLPGTGRETSSSKSLSLLSESWTSVALNLTTFSYINLIMYSTFIISQRITLWLNGRYEHWVMCYHGQTVKHYISVLEYTDRSPSCKL